MTEAGGQARHPAHSPPIGAKWRPGSGGSTPLSRRRRRALLAFVTLLGLGGILALIIYLFAFRGREIPPLQFVGIGITSYDEFPPRPGSLRDVNELTDLFTRLNGGRPQEFGPPIQTKDNLTRESLISELRRELAEETGSTVVAYVSLHTIAGPTGQSQLVSIHAGVDAVQGSDSTELIPLDDVVNVLLESPANQVILLVDAGRLYPDSRLGILGADGVQTLASLMESIDSPKLRVLCACSPGQESWTVTADTPVTETAAKQPDAPAQTSASAGNLGPRTLFGMVVQEALEGLCDGWQEGALANDAIDWQEFSTYVMTQVEQRAKAQSGEQQTVMTFGPESELELMIVKAIPPIPVEQAAAAAGEKPAPAGEGQPAAVAADAPKPGEPAANKPLTMPSLRAEIDTLWRDLDRVTNGPANPSDSRQRVTQKWRFLVLRAEEQLAAGLLTSASETISQVDQLLAVAAPVGGEAEGAGFDPTLLSANWWRLNSLGNSQLSDLEKSKWRKTADELIKKGLSPEPAAPLATTPTPAGTAPAAPASPWSDTANRVSFARWVWEEIKKSGTINRNAHPLLLQLQKEGWPANEWPIEFLTIDYLSRRANPIQTTALELRFLTAFDRLYKLIPTVWTSPQTFSQVSRDMSEIQHSLLAAERWLMAEPCPERLVVKWLEKAEKQLSEATAKATAWATLDELRLRAARDWPAYIAWIAEEQEATPLSVNYANIAPLAELLREHEGLNTEVLNQLSGLWPISGETETSASQTALKLFVEMQTVSLLLTAEQNAEALEEQEVIRLSNSLRDHLGLLRQHFDNEVTGLKNSSTATLADQQQIRRFLRSSLLSHTDRSLLRDRLKSRPAETLSSSSSGPTGVTESGLWRGFWAICQLQFAGAEPRLQKTLWNQWLSLGKGIESKSSDQVRLRAELGQEVNRSWGVLERELSDDSPGLGADRLAGLLQGLPGHPALNVERVQEPFRIAVLNQRNEILSAFAGPWTKQSYLSSALARLGAGGISVGSSAEPEFQIPAEVACDDRRQAKLELVATGENAADAVSYIVFDAGGGQATLRQRTSQVQLDALLPLEQSQAALHIEVASGLIQSETIALALVGADGFPFDIRRVSIFPPFDNSRFSIRFLTEPRGIPVYQSSGRDGTGGRIYLPPQGETALKPVLLRPAGDTTQKMSIRCHSGSRDGPVLFSLELPLPADQQQVPMVPAPPAAGATATPMPPQAGMNPGVDITEGLVFWLVPDDQPEKGFEFRVEPEFWLPTDFIETPEPVLVGNKIEIPVTSVPRRLKTMEEFDLLNPMQIGVSLHVNAALKEILLPAVTTELPELPLGKSGKLLLTVDAEKLEKSRSPLEMTLSVAGWPHAFRWRVTGTGIRRLRDPDVRVTAPLNDSVFTPPMKPEPFGTNVELQVFGDELDSGYAYNHEWAVDYTLSLRSDNFNDSPTGDGKEWPVFARMIRDIRLIGPTAGIWTIRTSASDFLTALDLRGKTGRFLLTARLTKGGVEQSTDTILFAVDSSPPTVGFNSIAKRHDYLKTLSVSVAATDAESRVRRLRIGLDLDKDQQLSNEEATWEEFDVGNPNQLSQTRTVKFSPQVLPQKEGAVRFIVEAENRAGMVSRDVAEVALFTPVVMIPEKVAPVVPTEGTLILNTDNRLGSVSVNGMEYKTSFGKPIPPITLKVGKYEVKWKTKVVGSVEIKGGETTRFDVPID